MINFAQNFYLIGFRIGKNGQEKKNFKKIKQKKSLKKKEKGFVQEIEQLAIKTI